MRWHSCPRLAGPEGIDAALDAQSLDALVAPTASPSWPVDLVNGDFVVPVDSQFREQPAVDLIELHLQSVHLSRSLCPDTDHFLDDIALLNAYR